MAITEHGSTPAVVRGQDGNQMTTASFSPPAGSVVVAMCASGWGPNTTTLTLTDSSGGGEWTRVSQNATSQYLGMSAVGYKVFATAPGSITVSATFNQWGPHDLVVRVLEGVDTEDPVGNSVTQNITGSTTDYNYPVTVESGSMVYISISTNDHSSAANTPVSGTTELDAYYINDQYLSSAFAFKSTSPADSAGSTNYGTVLGEASTGSLTAVEFRSASVVVGEDYTEDTSDTVTLSDSAGVERNIVESTSDTLTLSDSTSVEKSSLIVQNVEDVLSLDDVAHSDAAPASFTLITNTTVTISNES